MSLWALRIGPLRRPIGRRSPGLQATGRRDTTMAIGTIKFWNAEKGYGFISRDDGDDVFVSYRALLVPVQSLDAGTQVEFDTVAGRKGDEAGNVRIISDAPEQTTTPPAPTTTTGSTTTPPPATAPPTTVPLLRAFNPGSGDHF